MKDRWRFADLEVVLQKLEDKYLAGTAVRDIGLTIAGGEPPVWSQYQYVTTLSTPPPSLTHFVFA